MNDFTTSAGAMQAPAVSIAEALEAFLAPRVAVGHAQATLAQKRWAIGLVARVADTLPVTTEDLVAALTISDYSQASKKDMVRCWRTFFAWAATKYGHSDPTPALPRLPTKKQLPRILSPRELTRLVGACRSRRDLLLVLLPLDTGLRLSEIAGMRKGDIDDSWISVNGKTGDRTVVVSPEIADALEQIGDERHYWIGRWGPLTRSGVQQAYPRLFQRAGIDVGKDKNGAHALRHTFATQWIREGGGLPQLKEILGHSKLETVLIYVTLAMRDVQADHLVYSPARRLGFVEQLANDGLLPELTPTRAWRDGRDQEHDEKSAAIRKMAADGASGYAIQKRLGVGWSTIQAAIAAAV